MKYPLASEPCNRRPAIRRGVVLAALIGAFAPFFAHAAGDFSIGNAATFAQNIIESDSVYHGGGTIPAPPTVAADAFADAFPRDSAGTDAARVSGPPNSGHFADTDEETSAPVTAKLPRTPAEPMTTAPRPNYRWQSLVPGVLK